jgi:uncharacterized protein (TIGR02231 family)
MQNCSFRARVGASLLLCALLTHGSLAAAPAATAPAFIPASNAPVTHVVLYPGGAKIERAARVKAGAEILEIEGLPANFDAESLEVTADTGIEIGEVVWRDSARVAPLNAEEARLEAEVRALSDHLQMLEVDKKAATRELRYLETLATSGGDRETVTRGVPASPGQMLEVIRQGSRAAEKRILEVNAQTLDLQKRLDALRRDLDRVRPAVTTTRTLSVRLAAQREGMVRVSYLFADAGWRPAYRAALDSRRDEIALVRLAHVAQRSGEDWNRVRLVLSTGAPRQNADVPRPRPWNVELRENRPLAASARFVEGGVSESAPAPYAAKVDALRNAGPLFATQVTLGEYATEYAIPGVVSLPADGRKSTVELARQNLAVTLTVEVTPRLEETAYLVAQASLPEGVWPPGEVRLYRDGAYVGQAEWRLRQNQLALPFGRDEQVLVRRKSDADQRGSSGFVGQQAERHIADTYTLTSRHTRAVTLRVLEASPIGRNAEIHVERQFNPPPSGEDWNDIPGVVFWETRLEAGKSQGFSVDYRIRWPKERQAIGLP